MRLLSIDFGTSNTVVALAVDGQAPRTLTFDASPLLPSAVFLGADGSVTVGREAQRQARLDPSRYEPNPKRRIDDGEVLLGDRVVDVVDLIAAVLRNVAGEVRRQLGGAAPDEVRLTHPAQWGAPRQNTLVSAARAAGLGGNLVLIPEPVAAAAQYTQLPGRTLPAGGTVAIYDLGGGTFDIAVVGRTQNDFHVLAEAGLADLGGLDFDQAVLDHVGRMASATDPARWLQILRPTDASSRRAARALAEDVRAAKETLSRYPQTEVALPDPFADVHLTRPEFEGLIRPSLIRSIEVLQTTLRSAGVGPERLTGIFLVGGSSRIPLVAKLIQDQLGVIPVALDQPETAVALGALLMPVHREGNRTVAFGDRMSGPNLGPPSAGQPVLGPRSDRMPSTSPPQPATAAGAGTSSAVTGSGPSGRAAVVPGPPAVAAARSRAPIWVAIAVAAVLVAATVVLLVVKPFSGSADPGTTGLPTTRSPSSVSSGTGTGAPSSSVAVSSTPSGTADPNKPGVGPSKAMTPAELAYLGPAANKLINCGDSSSLFNNQVPEAYRMTRILRCEIPQSDDSSLIGRTLVYVLTAESPAAAKKLTDQIKKDRKKDQYTTEDKSGDTATSTGTLTLVTADHLQQLGTLRDGQGVPAIAWVLDKQPFVGVMVGLSAGSSGELLDYYNINYKPR